MSQLHRVVKYTLQGSELLYSSTIAIWNPEIQKYRQNVAVRTVKREKTIRENNYNNSNKNNDNNNNILLQNSNFYVYTLHLSKLLCPEVYH